MTNSPEGSPQDGKDALAQAEQTLRTAKFLAALIHAGVTESVALGSTRAFTISGEFEGERFSAFIDAQVSGKKESEGN